MKRFRGMSGRRKVLLAMLVLGLVFLLALHALGIAGLNGAGVRDMDWDGDGEVTRAEILQGYSSVVVHETREGNRVCRSFRRLREGDEALRVDCRVELVPQP